MEQRQCYDYKLSVVTFKQQFLIMKKGPTLCSFGIVTFRSPQVKLLTNIVKNANENLYLNQNSVEIFKLNLLRQKLKFISLIQCKITFTHVTANRH